MMAAHTDNVRETVIEAVLAIAPEADFAHLDTQRSLREQLDLDSFDFLNLLIALQQSLGVSVPEADYARVQSLDALVQYLASHGAH